MCCGDVLNNAMVMLSRRVHWCYDTMITMRCNGLSTISICRVYYVYVDHLALTKFLTKRSLGMCACRNLGSISNSRRIPTYCATAYHSVLLRENLFVFVSFTWPSSFVEWDRFWQSFLFIIFLSQPVQPQALAPSSSYWRRTLIPDTRLEHSCHWTDASLSIE